MYEDDDDTKDNILSTGNNASSFELPLASITRVSKSNLPQGVTMTREARQACSKAAGIFVLLLTSCANEYRKDGGHGTLGTADIFRALRGLNFDDYVDVLEDAMKNRKLAPKKRKKNDQDVADDADGVSGTKKNKSNDDGDDDDDGNNEDDDDDDGNADI